MQIRRSVYLCLAVAVALAGCRSASETKDPKPSPQGNTEAGALPQDGLRITGTVRHIPIEGGFYGIVADDGRHYDPVNLPAAFKEDGLPVACRARVLRNRASFHMWGQLVEILDIQRR